MVQILVYFKIRAVILGRWTKVATFDSEFARLAWTSHKVVCELCFVAMRLYD